MGRVQKFLMAAVLTLAGSGHMMAAKQHDPASSHRKEGVFDGDGVASRVRNSISQWPPLQRYLSGPHAIQITANTGQITLEGTVDSKADRDNIGARANAVPDMFWVDNRLRVGHR